MELKHEENYPGYDGEKVYQIRIFEESTKMTTLLSRVLLNSDGSEEILPFAEFSSPLTTAIPELVEKAKRTITTIWMNI